MNKLQAALHRAASAAIKHTLLLLCRLCFRPQVRYISETARREALAEPQVLICNHVRGMDGAVVYAALRRPRITALSAKDVQFTFPILQWLFRYLPVLIIDRENVTLSWLRDSRRLLREGEHIMIFPEGRCNQARVIQPFKPGAALLASSAGVRVTPIYHNGEYHPIFGPRFRMMVGEPITLPTPPHGISADGLAASDELLLHAMQQLELALNGSIRQ